MAWTTPATWATDEVPGSAKFNAHVRDNLLETAPAKVTTAEDLIVGAGANALKRLGVGTEGQILKVASGAVAWQTEPLDLDELSANLGSDTAVTGAYATLTSLTLSVGTWFVIAHVTFQLLSSGAQNVRFRLRDTTSGVTVAAIEWGTGDTVTSSTDKRGLACSGFRVVASGTPTIALQTQGNALLVKALLSDSEVAATGIRAFRVAD